MSTVKISELPVLSSADAADEFVVVDDSAGVTKKITQAGLADFGSNTLTAAGITFGSDTLDDYEEGTWTPVYVSNSTNPSGSYNFQIGYYIKIGNLVWASWRIQGGATSSTGSGSIQLGGFPFAIRDVGVFVGGSGLGFADGFNTHPLSFTVGSEGSNIIGLVKRSSVSGATSDLQAGDLGTSINDNRTLGTLIYQTS